jgi:hypothetical protein
MLTAMPHRQRPASRDQTPSSGGSFRQRYDEMEVRRDQLVTRLRTLGGAARTHPAYKRALKLLNDTFRKSKLGQRLAVLQAAAWLIDVLEQLTAAL